MKTRHVLLALAALALISTGMVWASSDDAAATESETATQAAEKVDIETSDDLLESIVPDVDYKDACCVADCFDEFSACMAECTNQSCRTACRADLTACRRTC